MRRLALLVASAAVVVVGSVAPGFATGSSQLPAGQTSQDAADAREEFNLARLAPNGAVDPMAFEAAGIDAAAIAPVGSRWIERTKLLGAEGNDFSDSPDYIDPTSNSSNSGAGDRWVAGRVTSLAAAPDGSAIFVGASDGGVWKSTDRGQTWSPMTDSQWTLSIGALLAVGGAGGYTIFAGTGEANTSSDSYAGVGVIAWQSTDPDGKWNRVGGSELNGALIFRLARSGNNVLAATSHGLYSIPLSGGTWNPILQPVPGPVDGKNFNLAVANMITDVAVLPGGQQILAVAGWRGGAATNGFYLSNDAGASFTYLANPQGWVPAKDQGRTTLAYSTGGDRLYAIVQSPYLLNVGTNGHTLLAGVYESAKGDPKGPWTKIADSSKLAASGSAQFIPRIGKGYQPGIQAWYNQFLAVDPSNMDHLYLGLEEVYETSNAGAGWNTIAPYWNFGFKCFAYSPFEGTCDHDQAHSDQHAAMITADGTLYIGNDGGVYSRSLSAEAIAGHWNNLNKHLDVLQYYSAMGSKNSIIYGGLQDNGSAKVFVSPTQEPVRDDRGQVIAKGVSSVQVFGGDGGYTLVDPADSNTVMTEYVGLTAYKSTDGGKNWIDVHPADPHPRFIAPIAMDRTNASHLVAGGAFVWSSDSGIAGTTIRTGGASDWQSIFDVRLATGATTSAQVTALDAVTLHNVEYVAAAWCGPCNVRFGSGTGFRSGIVMLNNSGGTWQATSQVCTGASAACAASGLPKRYIGGVKIDTADPSHAYLALSGYSRKWMIGPDDPGVGHVFETTTGGDVWSDISGNLPDVPTSDVVYVNGNVVVGTDIGVFTSATNGTTWSRLGTNLPNVVVDQLTLDPNNVLVAATHGRGVWTIPAPAAA